jgi:hypothetical protein
MKMKLSAKTLCMLSVTSVLFGCASGNPVSESIDVEAVPPGMSRIVIYRTQVTGTAVQPHVHVDGNETGKCQPEGAFTVDIAPGKHTLSVKTEKLTTIEVTTSASETVFIECSMTLGVMVGHPKLTPVRAETGREAIKELSLIGQFTL